MITEYAQIIEMDANRIKVEIRSSSGCGSCSAKAGCGNGILDRWLNPTRVMWLDANAELCGALSLGDEIQVGVEEGAFVRNALSLYLIPAIAFLVGAGSGFLLQGETLSIIGGVAGLLMGSVLVRYLVRHSPYASGFSPRILENNGSPSASKVSGVSGVQGVAV